MDSGLWISGQMFRSLPLTLQEALIERLRGQQSPAGAAPTVAQQTNQEDEPADLSPAQARRLIEGTGERTRAALRVIAESNGRFMMSHIRDALGDPNYDKLRAVWAALTRRTRTVLGDPEAELIRWVGYGVYQGDEYIDHEGYVSPTTYRSLRSCFSL
jgi:hypothetical protein